MMKSGMPKPRRRCEGFTLVEMVVSVTLIALMALALWSALRISISSWKRGTESMDDNQRHRATQDLMQKQIASISAIIPSLDLQLGVGQFPVFAGSEKTMQFITACPMRFRDNPGLAFVSFEIAQTHDGDLALIEHETRYLGGDPTQTVSFSANDPAITLFEHLSDASFQYLDPGDDQIPPQWVREWNSGDAGMLPAAVSMKLRRSDDGRIVQSRDIVIPFMAEPDNNQGFIDPFDGRGGLPGGGGRGRGDPGGGRGGRGGRGGDRGRGGSDMGPGGPGRGGMMPGGPGRGFGGIDFGRRGGPGNQTPPGGRRGGRFE